jgi:hypothetical protein
LSTAAWTQPLDIPARVLERALERYEVDENGCWISGFSVGSHGYAQIGWWADGRSHMITHHRATWTATNGPVPDGMTLDHICCVKRCVQPEHLRVLSMEANGRRGNRGVEAAIEGECLNGHGPMTRKERTMRGRRITVPHCLQCDRDAQRRYRESR